MEAETEVQLSELTSGSTDPSPEFAGMQKSSSSFPKYYEGSNRKLWPKSSDFAFQIRDFFTSSVPPDPLTFSLKPETALSQTSVFNVASGSGLSTGNTLSTVPPSSTDVSTSNGLFTHRTELSAEDLQQYEAKKFTLGKIPILPPPADLLLV